mmetsp:Transcript_41489/g.77752  ORF Transcript_41489/g.77752 Transcript_41489/m.77752 type:complete len:556 (+) Transcript_41489:134-1801(+)
MPPRTGLMQDWPLLTSTILRHASLVHGKRALVSRTVEGNLHRYTYADMSHRAELLAHALGHSLGVSLGDVVGTMAWNTYRHVEAWYAIMGVGAVCHTLNPRLFTEQLVYIANHGEDQAIFVDVDLLPVLEKMYPSLPALKHVVVLTDRAHMPKRSSIPALLCYEEILAEAESRKLGPYKWPVFSEETACGLCYTSGTTGNPKGVMYSHRSNVLHALLGAQAPCFNLSPAETILAVVPMFHANSWGIAFAAPMTGAALILPGPNMDGASIYSLLESERVTVTAAVPTVWLGLLQHLEASNLQLNHLKIMNVGGAACPRMLLEKFENVYKVEVRALWGMTELSPIGTMAPMGIDPSLSYEDRIALKLRQGYPVYGVEMKVVDDNGNELPRDGESCGHLMVRGPAITKSYFKGDGSVLDKDGYFDTGDVSTLHPDSLMQITDRAKDVIKSGGEWISSIEIENEAVGHPQVMEAAVIGVEHPKWTERPLLVIVAKDPSNPPPKADIYKFLEGKIATWWMPDDIVYVKEIPHTATGKIEKKKLRSDFAASGYKLPMQAKL